ncbi:MAG: AAA family ATPase [Candidatus Gracilibacteria bacterium]|jgi:hypothetical protein
MWIPRQTLKIIKKSLTVKKKIIILYGPRQVGKTSLLELLLEKKKVKNGFFNCELTTVKRQLESINPFATKSFFGDASIIVLDEAQKITNIGLALKQLIDTFPDMKIIATGSSSFDLANEVNEPLTGRALEYFLYPLSILELVEKNGLIETEESIEKILIYGLYPEIVLAGDELKEKLLVTLANQYLYKDVLAFEELKKPELLLKLLELLALQLGQEVSTHELATNLHVGCATVERYLDLLEKSFVIFPLRAYSRNARTEITKKRKIYFWDLGVRNAILNRFQPLNLRDDIGALWENFLIVERCKALSFQEKTVKTYFWRTFAQKELDYLEERNGIINAYEFKWQKGKSKKPVEFLNTYKEATFKEISRENFMEFIKA